MNVSPVYCCETPYLQVRLATLATSDERKSTGNRIVKIAHYYGALHRLLGEQGLSLGPAFSPSLVFVYSGLVWLVARCYGGQRRSASIARAPPCLYITHSLTLTRRARASASGLYGEERRNAVTRGRGGQIDADTKQGLPRVPRRGPATNRARVPRYYQWSASYRDDVLTQLSAAVSLPMTSPESEEATIADTNNGYAFFRDVLKWSRSVVPRAQFACPPPTPSSRAAEDPSATEPARSGAREIRTSVRDVRDALALCVRWRRLFPRWNDF